MLEQSNRAKQGLAEGAITTGQQKEYCHIQIKGIEAEIAIFKGQIDKLKANILNLLLQRKTFTKEIEDIELREKRK